MASLIGNQVAHTKAGEFKYKSQRAITHSTPATLVGFMFTGVQRGEPDRQSSELEDCDHLTIILLYDHLNLEILVSFVDRPLSEAIWE